MFSLNFAYTWHNWVEVQFFLDKDEIHVSIFGEHLGLAWKWRKIGSKSKVNDCKMITENEVKTAGNDGEAWRKEREVWLTICILFRGYQGTWLNPVRLNPLGEHCCQRPSRKPFTGTRSLLFTSLHLYSCQDWVIEVEVRERREREREDSSGPRRAIHLLFVSYKVLTHLTWTWLITFACDFHGSICL